MKIGHRQDLPSFLQAAEKSGRFGKADTAPPPSAEFEAGRSKIKRSSMESLNTSKILKDFWTNLYLRPKLFKTALDVEEDQGCT